MYGNWSIKNLFFFIIGLMKANIFCKKKKEISFNMAIIIHYYLVIHHVYQSLNEYHKMFIFNQSFAMNKPLKY